MYFELISAISIVWRTSFSRVEQRKRPGRINRVGCISNNRAWNDEFNYMSLISKYRILKQFKNGALRLISRFSSCALLELVGRCGTSSSVLKTERVVAQSEEAPSFRGNPASRLLIGVPSWPTKDFIPGARAFAADFPMRLERGLLNPLVTASHCIDNIL